MPARRSGGPSGWRPDRGLTISLVGPLLQISQERCSVPCSEDYEGNPGDNMTTRMTCLGTLGHCRAWPGRSRTY
jgi:hypothetical protein